MHFILGTVAAILAPNGLSGLILGSCIAAQRKRAGKSQGNNLTFVAHGSEARFYGIPSLAFGVFAAFQVSSIGNAS